MDDKRTADDLADMRRELRIGLVHLGIGELLASVVLVVAMTRGNLLGQIITLIIFGLMWLGWVGVIFLVAYLIEVG